jgi:hypothetical protein
MPPRIKEISLDDATPEGLIQCKGCSNVVDARGLSAHFITCPGAKGSPAQSLVNLCYITILVLLGALAIPMLYGIFTASNSLIQFIGTIAWKPLHLMKIPTAF